MESGVVEKWLSDGCNVMFTMRSEYEECEKCGQILACQFLQSFLFSCDSVCWPVHDLSLCLDVALISWCWRIDLSSLKLSVIGFTWWHQYLADTSVIGRAGLDTWNYDRWWHSLAYLLTYILSTSDRYSHNCRCQLLVVLSSRSK